MLASSVLDVGIGVMLVFLAVSFATSAVTEAIASLLGLRQAALRGAVGRMLDDPGFTGLAGALYAHPLLDPLGAAERQAGGPTWVRPSAFAAALVETLHRRASPPAAGGPPPEASARLAHAVATEAAPRARARLTTLLAAAEGDPERFRAAVERWFETAMFELAGFYKRRIQAISFVVALAISVAANADALHVIDLVWAHTMLVSGADLGRLQADGIATSTLLARLGRTGLLGWAGRPTDPLVQPWAFARMALGWLIVASASLYGAAFWFDLLARFVVIRGAGPPDVTVRR